MKKRLQKKPKGKGYDRPPRDKTLKRSEVKVK